MPDRNLTHSIDGHVFESFFAITVLIHIYIFTYTGISEGKIA